MIVLVNIIRSSSFGDAINGRRRDWAPQIPPRELPGVWHLLEKGKGDDKLIRKHHWRVSTYFPYIMKCYNKSYDIFIYLF